MEPIALLVDDERALRAYVSMVLQRGGFQVLEAGDGLDALTLLRGVRGAVNVLITDVKMPRMSGIELVEVVKTDFPDIPVVYVSAEGLRDRLDNPLGHITFLQKPFGPQAILEAVRSVTAPEAGQAVPLPPNGFSQGM